MKKLYFTLVILLISTVALTAAEFAGGTGTETEPYLVHTPAHLNNVRNCLDCYYEQTEDIDLAGFVNWEPLAGFTTPDRFTGHYDGKGFTISNLTINRPNIPNVGLFGHVGMDESGHTTLKNIRLVNVQVTGGRGTGALAGRITGNQNTRIEYCSVDGGEVHGNAAVGGLVGSNNSYRLNNANAESFRPVIFACWANVDVSMVPDNSDPSKIKYGGLAGCNQKGLISNSYALGNVTASEEADRIGGLAGCVEFRGIVINSFALGTVSGSGSRIGGLLGFGGQNQHSGTVISSYFLSSQPNNGEGAALTDAQMKIQSNFEDWDFFNIWEMGVGNPTLLNNQPSPSNIWTWNGSGSVEWNNAANWEGEGNDVPPIDGQAVVVIPAGITNWPVTNENIVLQDLRMGSNAQLTLMGTSLSISGKLEFVGDSEQLAEIITSDNGQLILAGQNAQDIPSMVFHNLTIENPNNVSLAGDITVKGSLNMNRGFLDLNDFDITMLGEDATLVENEDINTSSRVFGSSGKIIRVQTIVSGANPDIAGIGLGIETNQEMEVTIERGHSELEGSDAALSIMRWFNISPTVTPVGLNATVTFHYFLGELQEDETNPALSLFKREKEGDIWQPWEFVYSNTGNKKLVAENVKSFSQWTASDASTPMPIVLLSFEGKAVKDAVALSWVTAAELNNDYFTIERSRDGVQFNSIGTKTGAGTTNRMNHYKYIDNEPLDGVAYYRLKQTDFNGDFEYSKTISVLTRIVLAENIRLFPNPNYGHLRILTGGDKNMDFQIYDMLGKMVYSKIAAPGQVNHVDLSGLQKGIYTVVFFGDEVITKKIQIQ